MKTICFVSYEIHPTTWGGVGVFLSNVTKKLVETNHHVILLLDLSDDEFREFVNEDSLEFCNSKNCKVYQVNDLCNDIFPNDNHFSNLYVWRSYRFYYALKKLTCTEKIDLIEFFDYSGAAYHTIEAKISNLAFSDIPLAIRLHTSNSVMDTFQPVKLDRNYLIQYGLEHHALRLSDIVVYPSERYFLDTYKPHFPEKWNGQVQKSTPPLLLYLPEIKQETGNQNIFLFYGRLYGIKGAENFVQASILFLEKNPDSTCLFYLVGHDSYQTPIPGFIESYKTYLLQQIPIEYRDHFVFTGAISWEKLETILQNVIAAVFPSLLESFCYAAHELYAAGIPVILNDIPAFRDYFVHMENSLIYDGSTNDLTDKMLLMLDPGIRKKLAFPFPVTDIEMDNFYDKENFPSWITQQQTTEEIQLTICILLDKKQDLNAIIEISQELRSKVSASIKLFFFFPNSFAQNREGQSIWWLGNLYKVIDENGKLISRSKIVTSRALLILRSSDWINENFIEKALGIFSNNPEIVFVGCWQKIPRLLRKNDKINTSPVDSIIELLPFTKTDPLSRFILRTESGQPLLDVFDNRCGVWGELNYLWEIDNDEHNGIIIPEPWLRKKAEKNQLISESILSYMIQSNSKTTRNKKLSLLSAVRSKKSISWTSVNKLLLSPKNMYKQIVHIFYKNPSTNRYILQPLLQLKRRIIQK
ncbi:MAG: glycosyltransferase family 4 protein [Bacteroidales bacterium]|nr:glycosyltransferase family 4 protein [Bacteroidales bacterium]